MTCDATAGSGVSTKSACGIWLVRHAQPRVEAGICYGASDIPAHADATRRAAIALAQILPQGVQVVVSPLQRCRQLAHDVRLLRADLEWQVDLRLVEMNFGRFEGKRWSDISEAEIAEWSANFGDWRFGGVESVQMVMQRVAAAWDETVAKQQDAVWITHAGVIRAVNLLASGLRSISRADQWPAMPIKFGDVQKINLPGLQFTAVSN